MDTLTLAYGLIAIGILLMAAELLLPTHGVLLALGVGTVIVGVALTFREGLPTGMMTMVGVLIVVPIVGSALLRIWPKTPLGKRLFLHAPIDDDTVANMPVNLELDALRGRYGRTLSALRPCGLVDFDGKRIDTMTDGEMIEPDQWVRCVDIKSGHVLVRQVDAPPDLGTMDTELLGS